MRPESQQKALRFVTYTPELTEIKKPLESAVTRLTVVVVRQSTLPIIKIEARYYGPVLKLLVAFGVRCFLC